MRHDVTDFAVLSSTKYHCAIKLYYRVSARIICDDYVIVYGDKVDYELRRWSGRAGRRTYSGRADGWIVEYARSAQLGWPVLRFRSGE